MSSFELESLAGEITNILPAALANSTVIRNAQELAFKAHNGQFREQRLASAPPIPYIVHPFGVAKIAIANWDIVECEDSLETIVCSSLLHDVLEDSSVNYSEIESATSKRCADLVLALTKPELLDSTSHKERTQIFLSQIRADGESAIFLKICDCMHNLNRPGTMPFSLLKKTIIKASGPYTSLLDGTSFERQMKNLLSERIQSAKKILEKFSEDPDTISFEHLHLFIEDLLDKLKSKAFEVHDVSEVLSRIPGVKFCKVETHEKFFIDWPSCDDGIDDDVPKIIRSKLNSEEGYQLQPPKITTSQIKKLGYSQIFSVPLFDCHSCEDQTRVIAGVNLKQAPHWMGVAAMHAMVKLLSVGIAEKRRSDLTGITQTIFQAELDIIPTEQTIGRLTYQDVFNLKRVVENGEFCLKLLRPLLDNFLKDFESKDHILNVEDRVKTPKSILAKMSSREMRPDEVDDLVGMRIIFLSQAPRDALAIFLRKELVNQSGIFGILPIGEDSIRVDDISSNIGYTAKHIRFNVRLQDNIKDRVSCEIQLRTIQEDWWARVSELFAYKDELIPKKKAIRLLKELASIRNDADQKISRTVKSKSEPT